MTSIFLHQEFVGSCLVELVPHTQRYWRESDVPIKVISIDCDNRWAVDVASPELRGGEKREEDEGTDCGQPESAVKKKITVEIADKAGCRWIYVSNG